MNTCHRTSSRLEIALFAVSLFFVSGLEMYACSCGGKLSVEKAVRTADLLVTGTIIAKDSYADFIRYTVVVSRDFKHTALGDTISIYSGYGSGGCGFVFVPGKEYIIYADVSPYLEKYFANEHNERTGQKYITSICTRTQKKNDEEIENIEKEL